MSAAGFDEVDEVASLLISGDQGLIYLLKSSSPSDCFGNKLVPLLGVMREGRMEQPADLFP